MQRKGLILDIHRFALQDGPGIRTTVFLKGCPLNCLWCHNPESIQPVPEVAYFATRCTHCGECVKVCPTGAQQLSDGVHHFDRSLCSHCYRCTNACLFDALRCYGKSMTTAEVIKEIEKDMAYYIQSGGGITISGGEPFMQPEFTRELLKACKKKGINTCVDTSGFVPTSVLESMLPWIDLLLFDYKAEASDHNKFTGTGQSLIHQNLEFLLKRGIAFELRCPMIQGVNDSDNHLIEIARLSGLSQKVTVRIMPYHNTGNAKYERFGYGKSPLQVENTSEETRSVWMEKLRQWGGKNILAD